MGQSYDKISDRKILPAPVLKLESFTGEVEPGSPEKESYVDKFLRSVMDQAKDYPAPVSVIDLVQNGNTIPLLTLKSYSLWQGKQKSKKTTLLAMAIAAFIDENGRPGNTTFLRALDGVVLFFDTEQGESYAARTMKLILKMAGRQISPRLIYCDLREFPPLERMCIIEAGIQTTANVRLVVIDGVVDLLNDFMDAGEGHMSLTHIVSWCSKYDIHVAGVLHQNKADKNARAHVGTISSQKCEIEISTEVDPYDRNRSLVICVNSRGLPFESFAIRWDKGSLPLIDQEYSGVPSGDVKAQRVMKLGDDIAKAVFKPLAALRQTEAIVGIMNVAGKSKSTAKRYLEDLLGWKKVIKGPDGLYRINMTKNDIL